jgi:hypothetical protein
MHARGKQVEKWTSDINLLVRERIEKNVDLSELIAEITEGLAETIMLAPQQQWTKLTENAIQHLGKVIIEKIQEDDPKVHLVS